MTARIRCAISTCRWFHNTVATGVVLAAGPNPAYWNAATWAVLDGVEGDGLTVSSRVAAHLATHMSHEWMAEIRREHDRAYAAERLRDMLIGAMRGAAAFTSAMDALTTMRMPSRAEVEQVNIQRSKEYTS